MNRYIETKGEGQYQSAVARYLADVSLEVRAANNDTAFAEVAELRTQAIAVLLGNGIDRHELSEGRTEFKRPWFWKRKAGQSATRKVTIKASEIGRMIGALEALEPLQEKDKQRKTVSVDMRQPEFNDSPELEAAALSDAFDVAKMKANAIADRIGAKLGDVLHLEEGKRSKRNSGLIGDADWGGDDSRIGFGGAVMLAAPGGGGDGTDAIDESLEESSRTIFVTCTVRFSLVQTSG